MSRDFTEELAPHWRAKLLAESGASALTSLELVQTLWSGYGQILRCRLEGASSPSVILKHVRVPSRKQHPRGWNSSLSHERKLRSYQVESSFYQRQAPLCSKASRVPACLAVQSAGDEVFLLLEDLDAAGFERRLDKANDEALSSCLSWLAQFHATFMGKAPQGLWQVGTYWHLETRPEELAALQEGPLKEAAAQIDRRLKDTAFPTLVHGDAKLANFCFASDATRVAAVDFQYVGGGCGIKDVAYFLSSCLGEDEIEARESELLDLYFHALQVALKKLGNELDFQALESEWRQLYPVAWTDFLRFLKGWSPGHWKVHRYSERLAREVLERL